MKIQFLFSISGDIIMATDLSRLPNSHIKSADNQFMGAVTPKNHFTSDQSYTQLKSIMDISNGSGGGNNDHESNIMRGGKYFMDFSYRNYYKNLQDIQGGSLKASGYDDVQLHHPPNTDYDDSAQCQPNHQTHGSMSPANLQHLQSGSAMDNNSLDVTDQEAAINKYSGVGGGDSTEKAIKTNYDAYMKGFDGAIRAKQLDEMQNCDMNNHDTLGANNGNAANKLNDECSSSDARNYASSDDMNQTASSERDDKIGSGSEDEGESLTKRIRNLFVNVRFFNR